jgi:hypothetical protein
MMPRSDIPEIRAGLQAQIHKLVKELLPRGRSESGQWVSTNPTVAGDDRKIPALKVRISGGDIGAWTDYRHGRDGHKGDVIGLVAYLNGTDTKGALAWARDFLGLKTLSRAEREAMRFAAAKKREAEEKRAEQKRRWSLLEADRLFMTPAGAGDYGPAFTEGTDPGGAAAAHAAAYFAARKCAPGDIATLNRLSFRFSRGTEWWKGAQWKTGAGGRKVKAERGPMFPAIHSAMRSPIGIVTCCHVTFLDPARPAKAPVETAKLMFGEKKGAVIEIATGPSGTPFWQWSDDTRPCPVIIAEGIETAATIAVELSGEARIWAAGDLSNMGEVPAHLPIVSAIFVARDNNAGNAQAQKQLERALERLERHEKPMSVMASHVGDDFNDLAE